MKTFLIIGVQTIWAIGIWELLFRRFVFGKGKRSAAAEGGSAPATGCADRAAVKQTGAVSYAVAPTQSGLAAIGQYLRGRHKAITASINSEILAGNKCKEDAERTALVEIEEMQKRFGGLIAASARRSAGEQASRRNVSSSATAAGNNAPPKPGSRESSMPSQNCRGSGCWLQRFVRRLVKYANEPASDGCITR